MTGDKIDTYLALRSGGRLLLARDRIQLLEAVARHRSITKAAKETGYSYKTVWEAVDAINNLLPTPAIITRAGGRIGGGAEITDEGRRLIDTFHRLEARLQRISVALAEEGLERLEETPFWSLGLRISARNVFKAEVTEVHRTRVDVDVTLKVSDRTFIGAAVTNAAAEELDLRPGRHALALVKAPFVSLHPPGEIEAGGLNVFPGTVRSRVDGEINSEVHLEIGGGKTIVALVPIERMRALGIEEGAEATAHFDADHVILAVE